MEKYAEKGLINLTLEDCLELAKMDFDIIIDNGFVVDIKYNSNNNNK